VSTAALALNCWEAWQSSFPDTRYDSVFFKAMKSLKTIFSPLCEMGWPGLWVLLWAQCQGSKVGGNKKNALFPVNPTRKTNQFNKTYFLLYVFDNYLLLKVTVSGFPNTLR
jgi:hypothetical protein